MKTIIKTIHEENFLQGEINKVIGVLTNYTMDGKWNESLIYIYSNGTYIFFNTLIELFDYVFYGEKTMKRAYMEEKNFDVYYDSNDIDGKFSEHLNWTN